MKILLFADPHWSTYSSLVRSRGKEYSTRLENLISSLNWLEDIAVEKKCDSIFCLGDFFDQSTLSAEEIAALNKVRWIKWNHYRKSLLFLIGNHEMARNDLSMSSAHLFNMAKNSTVIDSPSQYRINDIEFCFLPYVLESDRKKIIDYFGEKKSKRIIFSHNDIKGIQMGKFISQEGFSIDDIENNCDLFINGHLHNGAQITDKIINLGNLTGQNFSENGIVYKHNVMILDTNTLKYELVENTFSMKFIQYDFTHTNRFDIDKFLHSTPTNAVLTIKCLEKDKQYIEENLTNTIAYRILIEKEQSNINTNEKFESVDHISQFVDYIKREVGTDELTYDELMKVAGI